MIAGKSKDLKENSEEEWSVIDLKDDKSLMNKENLNSKGKSSHGSALKHINGAASVSGFVSSNKHEKSIFDSPPLHKQQTEGKTILTEESVPPKPAKESGGGSSKRKPFKALFHKEQRGKLVKKQ